MKIGIIQGRLTEPKMGFQECPKNWKREFDLLKQLGLNHIEWIITRQHYNKNPFFDTPLKGLPISSVCADFLVDEHFLNKSYYKETFKNVCEKAEEDNIKFITIPLLEESSVVGADKRKKFIDIIAPYAEKYKNLNFSIEAELEAEQLLEIVTKFDNFYITYDTGNMTSFDVNHKEYIDLVFEKINNVHLKDRTFNGKTVIPGAGDTNFALILNKLNKMGYDKLYTIQTARDLEGKEIDTIMSHKEYFQELIK